MLPPVSHYTLRPLRFRIVRLLQKTAAFADQDNRRVYYRSVLSQLIDWSEAIPEIEEEKAEARRQQQEQEVEQLSNLLKEEDIEEQDEEEGTDDKEEKQADDSAANSQPQEPHLEHSDCMLTHPLETVPQHLSLLLERQRARQILKSALEPFFPPAKDSDDAGAAHSTGAIRSYRTAAALPRGRAQIIGHHRRHDEPSPAPSSASSPSSSSSSRRSSVAASHADSFKTASSRHSQSSASRSRWTAHGADADLSSFVDEFGDEEEEQGGFSTEHSTLFAAKTLNSDAAETLTRVEKLNQLAAAQRSHHCQRNESFHRRVAALDSQMNDDDREEQVSLSIT